MKKLMLLLPLMLLAACSHNSKDEVTVSTVCNDAKNACQSSTVLCGQDRVAKLSFDVEQTCVQVKSFCARVGAVCDVDAVVTPTPVPSE